MTAFAWPRDLVDPAGAPVPDLATLPPVPAFIAPLRHATRAQAAIRAFARVTNLSVAGTATAVEGTGPVAMALARMLREAGARVTVAGADPRALVAFAAAGFDATEGVLRADAVAVAFVTGEEAPLPREDGTAPAQPPLVIVDLRADAVEHGTGPGPRPGLVVADTVAESATRGSVILTLGDDDETRRAESALARGWAAALGEARGDRAAAERLLARAVIG